MERTVNERLELDTLRGMACVLLVSYHVIGGTPAYGMQVDDGPYRWAADGLVFIRMPLFTFLSGFVYAYRPVSQPGEFAFLTGKARRLLVPFVTVTVLFFCSKRLLSVGDPVDPGDVARGLLWPVEPYWYLHALFWIFTVMVLVERYGVMRSPRPWAATLSVACGLFFLSPSAPDVLAFDRALYLFPFFVLGAGLCRFRTLLAARAVRAAAAAAAVLVFTASLWGQAIGAEVASQRVSHVGLAVGLFGCVALHLSGIGIAWLARLGVYSFAIYLYHQFGIAAADIVAPEGTPQFVFGLILGVAGPIVLYWMAVRTPLTRLLFLGQSYRSMPRRPAHMAERTAAKTAGVEGT